MKTWPIGELHVAVHGTAGFGVIPIHPNGTPFMMLGTTVEQLRDACNESLGRIPPPINHDTINRVAEQCLLNPEQLAEALDKLGVKHGWFPF